MPLIGQTASTAASNSSEMKSLYTQVGNLEERLLKPEAGASTAESQALSRERLFPAELLDKV